MGLPRSIFSLPKQRRITPLVGHFLVETHVRGRLSPAEARDLAVELLYAADEAEGGSAAAAMEEFGYDAQDSRELGELQSAIVEHLGWSSDEQELDADYRARVIEAGKILRERHLRLVKP